MIIHDPFLVTLIKIIVTLSLDSTPEHTCLPKSWRHGPGEQVALTSNGLTRPHMSCHMVSECKCSLCASAKTYQNQWLIRGTIDQNQILIWVVCLWFLPVCRICSATTRNTLICSVATLRKVDWNSFPMVSVKIKTPLLSKPCSSSRMSAASCLAWLKRLELSNVNRASWCAVSPASNDREHRSQKWPMSDSANLVVDESIMVAGFNQLFILFKATNIQKETGWNSKFEEASSDDLFQMTPLMYSLTCGAVEVSTWTSSKLYACWAGACCVCVVCDCVCVCYFLMWLCKVIHIGRQYSVSACVAIRSACSTTGAKKTQIPLQLQVTWQLGWRTNCSTHTSGIQSLTGQ